MFIKTNKTEAKKMAKKSPFGINYKIINKTEIARSLGYSPQYVRLLLLGKRTNRLALEKVLQAIKMQTNKAA